MQSSVFNVGMPTCGTYLIGALIGRQVLGNRLENVVATAEATAGGEDGLSQKTRFSPNTETSSAANILVGVFVGRRDSTCKRFETA